MWRKDCIQCVNDLIKFWQKSIYFAELSPFSDFGILYSKATFEQNNWRSA